MKQAMMLLLLVLSCAAQTAALSAKQQGAGVAKVIQMLSDMLAKSKTEKNDEQVAFAKFSTYCDMETASLSEDIKKAGETVELLEASIVKLTSDAKSLGEDVAALQAGIEEDETQMKEQKEQREKDHADFVAESTDYGESVSALDRAIAVMERQNYDRTAAATALIQVASSNRIPEKAQAIIASFVQSLGGDLLQDGDDDDDATSYSAPEANAYEFQSSGIIDLMKKLRAEFKQKKGQCEIEEMDQVHAFDMVMQDLTDSVADAKKEIPEKAAAKATKLTQAAEAKKSLASTNVGQKEDEKTLSDLKNECKEKKLSYEEKQALRTGEIEAIAKAIEVMQAPQVASSADLSFFQRSATSLLQVGESNTASAKAQTVRNHVRQFLSSEAQRLKSKSLGLLAMKLAEDPFAKVKSLIDNMITRLLEEAHADAEKEGFCDTEMGKSKITRTKLNEEIDGLSAAIEGGKSTIMMLGEEIETLNKEVADLQGGMLKATGLREEEKAANTVVIEDAVSAQQAVKAATAVLSDFYEKAAMATGFLQTNSQKQPIKMGTPEWQSLANPNFEESEGSVVDGTMDTGHKAGMQTFGETYTGQQDSAAGVLALLEVIQSDFTSLEADTKAAEAEAQSLYEKFMTQSKKSIAMKTKKVEMDTADRAAATSKMQQDVTELKSTQDELIAAEKYHEEIEEQCVDKGMTFEERTKAREAEIASLKQALEILGSEDIETSA